LGAERSTFPLQIHDLEPGAIVKRHDYSIVAVNAVHRGPSALTYGLIEDERRGRFNPDRARELGIPEGPLWGRIHRGDSVRLDDGRVIEPSELVGPTRSGRRIVITGDTRPCEATVELARGADLLVHEATFAEEEAERARETGHSTAREAADVAMRAGVRRLVLTHLSARYTRDTTDLEREARAVFPATTIARDGMEVNVPFRDESAEEAVPIPEPNSAWKP
jgi:ribonuclease Z